MLRAVLLRVDVWVVADCVALPLQLLIRNIGSSFLIYPIHSPTFQRKLLLLYYLRVLPCYFFIFLAFSLVFYRFPRILLHCFSVFRCCFSIFPSFPRIFLRLLSIFLPCLSIFPCCSSVFPPYFSIFHCCLCMFLPCLSIFLCCSPIFL